MENISENASQTGYDHESIARDSLGVSFAGMQALDP